MKVKLEGQSKPYHPKDTDKVECLVHGVVTMSMTNEDQVTQADDVKNKSHGGMGQIISGIGIVNRTLPLNRQSDDLLLCRALAILHRFGTENTGWRAFFRRWYYSDEPLRNDAANLVREAGFAMPRPNRTRLIGDHSKQIQ